MVSTNYSKQCMHISVSLGLIYFILYVLCYLKYDSNSVYPLQITCVFCERATLYCLKMKEVEQYNESSFLSADNNKMSNNFSSFRDNRTLATVLMVLLLLSSIMMFPYFMTPEPPIFLLLWLYFIPIFVFFYSVFLAIFVW